MHWRAHEGRNAGKDFDVISNPAEIASATTATQAGDWETSYSSVAADGSVYLHAVDSHPDNARSLFDPPLLLAPSTLAAIDEVKVNSAMLVVTLPAATAERASGTGSRTVRYVGDETISVDGKPRVAKVVEIEFIAELTTARVVRQSTLWVLPGEGVVAEEWNETLTILKLFPSKSRQTSTRIGVELSARPRDHRPTSQ